MTNRTKPSALWPVVLVTTTLTALALDLTGHAGRLAFTVPCTVFAVLLVLAHAWRRSQAPAASTDAAPAADGAASAASAVHQVPGLWATTEPQG